MKAEYEFFDWLVGPGFSLVDDESLAAIKKHGFDQTPASAEMTLHEKIVILGEEFGEVCRAVTYDGSNRGDLRAEAIQLATMALMIAYAAED